MAISQMEKILFLSDKGICLDTKTIFLNGEVNEEMYEKVMLGFHILNQSPAQVTIHLNSGGGDVLQCKAIYDVIKNSSNFVEIVVWGEASSSASVILMAGDTRVMTENSYIMLHQGEESLAPSKPRDIDNMINQMRKDELFIFGTYADKLNEKQRKNKHKLLTAEKVRDMFENDTYIDATKALQLGLITQIGYKI